MIGASTGLFGAVWAQAEVRKALKASGAHVLESELPVGMADCAFDADDTLADPELTARLGDLLGDLCARFARRSSSRHDGKRMMDAARLPLFDDGQPPRERADAARNRLRILEAAAELVDERGIEHVSMDDVARAAGVGTGTLYRRFGDRAGLALALLDEHTREFQDALISGPPPLGPGVPAAERLRAFGEGYLDLLERHAELLVVAEPPGAHRRRRPVRALRTHLAILLREAAPHVDARVHRAGAARDAAPGAAPVRAARPRLVARARALRLVRPRRLAQRRTARSP